MKEAETSEENGSSSQANGVPASTLTPLQLTSFVVVGSSPTSRRAHSISFFPPARHDDRQRRSVSRYT